MSNHSNKRSVQHISGMTLPQKREIHSSEWRLLIGEPKVTKKRPGEDGEGEGDGGGCGDGGQCELLSRLLC